MAPQDSCSLSADAIAAQLQVLFEQREFGSAFLMFCKKNSHEFTELLKDSAISPQLNSLYFEYFKSVESQVEREIREKLTPQISKEIHREQLAIQKKALVQALDISPEGADSILTLITAIKGLTNNA